MEPEPSIRQTGEDALVARLLPLMPSNPSLETGPGDDCAIIRGSGNRQLLLKTDCVVEGMHFLPGTDPELIGRKALARAVSDIGAMGGTPLHALVTLFVHADRPISQVEGILPRHGEAGAAVRHQHRRGGESSGLPADGLIINVALTGEVEEGKAVLRSTARAGDLIAVTGTLGGSFPTGHHLSFMPRVREGGILAASGVATSMMDLSDGLGTDLPRLAAASGLGFRIHEELLPVRPGFTAAQAVGDGEDYELLVTFRPGDRERAARLAAEHFPETPLTVIGEMTAETASALPPGYRHFS
ncbi:MAG: thiamine-phosphate kinase [Akkermansia muciniphila]